MARILITGSNGGFGLPTVQRLCARGHGVAAGLRDPEGRNRGAAEALRSSGALPVDLDVTTDAGVARSVEQTMAALGGLDVLIHNAGVGVLGLQEAFTPEDWQRVFDVNVFGPHRLNRAALPWLRQSPGGLVVFVSSLLGRITMPFYGPYNASKWAVEAMAENTRWELAPLGLDCCVVEPGGFPTTFVSSLLRPSDLGRAESYGAFGALPEGFLAGFEATLAAHPEQDPALVGEALVALVEGRPGERPFRTVVDRLGMGDAVAPLNAAQAQVTEQLFRAFGLGHLLAPAPREA